MARPIVVTSKLCALHDCPGHPESQDRLITALQGVPAGISLERPVPAGREDLCRVHDPAYVRNIEELAAGCPEGICRHLDADTYITRHSFEVACHAAGGAILAAGRALDGEPAFALLRPPGHHAGKASAMGFCIINNAAVAAAAVLNRAGRVAIVDWDVHHGNGTQEIFYSSDRVLYCSVHQFPWYPGSGSREETGRGPGEGLTINSPLPPGSGMPEYRRAFTEDFIPAIAVFDPSLILVSAGQDCLRDDPLGHMELAPEDLGTLTGLLTGTGIPVSLVLEGGYGPSHGQAITAIFDVLARS